MVKGFHLPGTYPWALGHLGMYPSTLEDFRCPTLELQDLSMETPGFFSSMIVIIAIMSHPPSIIPSNIYHSTYSRYTALAAWQLGSVSIHPYTVSPRIRGSGGVQLRKHLSHRYICPPHLLIYGVRPCQVCPFLQKRPHRGRTSRTIMEWSNPT